MIMENKISLNGKIIDTPITFANEQDEIRINKKKIVLKKKIEIYKYFKPKKILY